MYKHLISIIIVFLGLQVAYAQPVIGTTTGKKTSLDSLLLQKDAVSDNEPSDSVSFEYSRDSLADPIEYAAKDSMIYDIPNQKVYLYGNASVKQKNLLVTAAFILIDNKTNLLAAEVGADGKKDRVHFKDSEQDIVADRIKYNFKTKKGKVYNTKTKQGEGDYVQSEEAKFVAANATAGISDDAIYGKNALITTCDHDDPHFGLLCSKQKIIANKMIVVGPSTLVVGGVPTPLIVPFGFFPITKGRHGGFLMPDNYETSLTLGIGLKNIGWYFPINNNMDLQLRGDIYTRGTWRAHSTLRYIKRYRSQGSVNISYSSYKEGDPLSLKEYSDRRDVSIGWQHSQDRAANPNQSFSANVNIATGEALRYQRTDAASRTAATLSSNISYTRFLGNGYQISTSFTHSQNIGDRSMVLSLPNMSFGTPTLFPFKRKNGIGEERWYEKINLSYNTTFTTRLTTKDTTFFKGDLNAIRNQVQAGMTNSIPISASFDLLKHFKITPTITYNENWHFTKNTRTFDTTDILTKRNLKGELDTIQSGKINNTTSLGFNRTNSFSAGAGISTNLFGTLNFNNKKQGLRMIRHVLRPTLGFQYAPENAQLQYIDSTRYTLAWRDRYKRNKYNYFEQNPATFLSNTKQNALTLGINSSFQTKYAVKTDSVFTEKKGEPINFNLNTSYNLAADSFKLQPLSMNISTNLFKILNVTGFASFDAYAQTKKGRRLRNFAYYSEGDKIAHFQNANFSASTFFDANRLKEWFGGKSTAQTPPQNNQQKTKTPDKDFITSGSVNYNFNIGAVKAKNGEDSIRVATHDISFQINLNLTNSWMLNVGRIGYDIEGKRLTYPEFSVYRDLHCWEMGMSAQPLNDTYSFFLRAKPGTFSALNLPYNKNNFDPRQF